jgi:hypothetical protein
MQSILFRKKMEARVKPWVKERFNLSGTRFSYLPVCTENFIRFDWAGI